MKYIMKINRIGFVFDKKDQRNNALNAIIKGQLVELNYNGGVEKNRDDVKFSFGELPDDYDEKEEE